MSDAQGAPHAFDQRKTRYAGFADHEQTAGGREIPVIVLERA
jgi:hypothetical protein